LGELNVNPPSGVDIRPPRDLTSVIADWEQNRSISFAGDLISAALVSGNLAAARDASEFVVSSPGEDVPQLRALARRVLGNELRTQPKIAVNLDLSCGRALQGSPEISLARKRLRNYPSDAVLWMDLAYFYAGRGLPKKAERAVRIALNLAPGNRFILRSAARFFIHIDRPDVAHDLIRRAPAYKGDPWLLAAEISVAQVARRTPWSVRESFSLLAAEKFGPHQLSELSSALGTLEFHSGNSNKAKKLFRRSLIQPNDNSLAQARRIWPDVWGTPADFNVDQFKIDRPFEAQAYEALGREDWVTAFFASLEWLADQPFSSEPVRLASYLASTVFEDFERAEALLNFGLVANPEYQVLRVGLAFCYASTGRRNEAYSELAQIKVPGAEDWVGAAVEANYGLLAFRGGNVEAGRKHYGAAVRMADLIEDKRTKLSALVYWANEELIVPDSNSVRLLAEAQETGKSALGFFNSFLLKRLAERISRKLA
jgi:tetratricopeptide (TPR) repeat protein